LATVGFANFANPPKRSRRAFISLDHKSCVKSDALNAYKVPGTPGAL
jgi:hypothetical protein